MLQRCYSPRMTRMSGELILVVDDEANIVELARLYLEREGFRVSAVDIIR